MARYMYAHFYSMYTAVADLEGAEPAPPPPPWATDRRRYGTPNKSTRWCIMATPSSVNLEAGYNDASIIISLQTRGELGCKLPKVIQYI